MPLSFWSKRFPRLARRPRKLPAPHRPFRPCVESLEPRTAPAVLTVTSAADTHQAGLLTLREAVAAANTDAAVGQSDTIIFDPALGGATIKLTAGPLEQSGVSSTATETIDGGGWITVSGDDTSGVFTVDTGVTATLTGLTIADGNATNGSGGGIYNAGTLTITNCNVRGNLVKGTLPNYPEGGGIYNADTLTVTASTFSGNSALAGPGSFGGGIANNARMTVIDSTFSVNSAGMGAGGGIYNGGTLTLSASTLAGNSALYAGGIENYGTLTLSNSTLSGNAAASFGGGLWSAAFAPVAVVLTDVTITANRANTAGLAVKAAASSSIPALTGGRCCTTR